MWNKKPFIVLGWATLVSLSVILIMSAGPRLENYISLFFTLNLILTASVELKSRSRLQAETDFASELKEMKTKLNEIAGTVSEIKKAIEE